MRKLKVAEPRRRAPGSPPSRANRKIRGRRGRSDWRPARRRIAIKTSGPKVVCEREAVGENRNSILPIRLSMDRVKSLDVL